MLMQSKLAGLRQRILIPIHWAYTIRSYLKTCHVPMKPISMEDLPSDPNILPPKFGKLHGRPRTKRIRKGAWNRQKRKCGNCKQTGHNTGRCTGLPATKNGRGEGSPDWAAIDNDDSGESEISRLRSNDFEGMEI